MNSCLYIGPTQNAWCWKFFPEKSPGELPIAGKSWYRHAIDISSLLRVGNVSIVDCFMHDGLPSRLGDGHFWSLKLHYTAGFPCATPDELLQLHRDRIPADDDLLIFWGLVLPEITDVQTLLQDLRPVEKVPDVLPDGIWLRREGKLYECVCPMMRADSLRSYFDINFRLLNHPGVCTLPGYSGEAGCHIGMDVIIKLNCDLLKPMVICDNVCIEHGVSMRGGVIIGQGVLVDENTELDHAIVLDHTYIGKDTSLRGKIVDGNRVIDPETSAMVELEDKFLTSSTRSGVDRNCCLAEQLIALMLVIGLLPFYLLTLLLEPLFLKLEFFRFVHRIYPKCCLVLGRRARLVRCGLNDHQYVFRYSDRWTLHQDEHRKVLLDMYFFYHPTVVNMLKVVVISLLKRFFILKPTPDNEVSAEGRA